ncbi:ATP-binding protein [Spiractinospora alimapuensis]|uniref:NACHT domain-containing protein n=1 Tax=Spiractinospora alimapuensis TaxID=2820884 RepID=UPI001F2AB40A|nr:ATP-binding protein [Spiractinospora alimapuensis]QVQ53024.1 ATP-binding protein [Spiractinospora alimapuensis]
MSGSRSALSYAEALRVLGGGDSAAAAFAERVAEGALELLGVPGLGGLRGLIVKHGREQLGRLTGTLRGAGRLDRSDRLAAAHAIIVVEAYFEALAEDPPEGIPMEFSAAEKSALGSVESVPDGRSALLRQLASAPIPLPSPSRSPEENRLAVQEYLDTTLVAATRRFVRGLAWWDEADETRRGALLDALGRVTGRAMTRYAESYRQLVAEHAEFAAWNAGVEHAATRHRVETGLAQLGGLLARMSTGPTAGERRSVLAARHRAVLTRPILDTPEIPRGFVLPTLEESYINPRGRVGQAVRDVQPGSDAWAEDSPLRDDIQSVLAGELTGPDAVDRPLVLLGHPGSGKSLLTQVLAARLPAEDFLPIRVTLRDVPADAPVREQIEHALREAIGEPMSWADVARSAEGALPVVLLDGFDELLQAAGKDQGDYLERVREFQRREAELGRPLAAVVTSRTVVGDRVRFPDRCPVIRLEPLTSAQIRRGLAVWNDANPTADPLTLDHLTPVRELAEQPLMLQMLMLYDVEGAALRTGTELSRSGLYTELLTAFAAREVRRAHSHLVAAETARAVEEELRQLEVAALGMFLRQGQRITADQLDTDLAALRAEPPQPAQAAQAAPSPTGGGPDARRVLGRFFFVNVSRANDQHHERLVYEFLHATFGEFLVARAVVSAVVDLATARAESARGRLPTPLDDGPLYALCSFGVLARRSPVVEFVEELLAHRFGSALVRRSDVHALLVELFRAAPYPHPARSRGGYEPIRLPVTSRQARYTANLLCLLVLVSPEPIDIAELFPDAEDSRAAWRGQAGQWLDLPWDGWHGMLDTVRLRHTAADDGSLVSVVERERGDPLNVGECLGLEMRHAGDIDIVDPRAIEVPAAGITGRLLRSIALRVNGTAARTTLTLLPYLRHVSDLLTEWFDDAVDAGVLWSQTHDILELRLAPPSTDPRGRLTRYERLLATRTLGRIELLTLRQATEDLAVLKHRPSPPPTGDTESTMDTDLYRSFLRSTVLRYLDQLHRRVEGPVLHPREVRPVLDHLASHLPQKDSPAVHHVRDRLAKQATPPQRPAPVAAAGDTPGPGAGPPRGATGGGRVDPTLSRRNEHARQFGSGGGTKGLHGSAG